ncbi:MAG TPA: SRPBCC family protein [Candidatus Limnocylindrales bacterium]|jgi:uncharacterized membrane protein|nr:SRPBCC family protein [Candidatus Limnocylindrales bacterium]
MNQTASIHAGNAIPARQSSSSAVSRWTAIIGGSALAVLGLTRRSKPGMAIAAAGGALAYFGSRAASNPKEMVARSSIQLNCSPEEAFQFWRHFENLPRFMRHLESVSITGERRSRWTAIGPLGKRLRWDAEIVAERPGELISWRSLEGSDLMLDGFVEFQAAPGDRGTTVFATIIYTPPGGQLGRAAAKMLGKDPSFLMRQDLRRFKALLETGEIPTTEGQTHGPRTRVTAAARLLDPDQPFPRNAKVSDALEAQRRIS